MARIYTKTGDDGKTTIGGGKRVWKNSLQIETLGAIDELNSALGICRVFIKSKRIKNIILDIQNDIFVIQAIIASFNKEFSPERTKKLEKLIDKFSKNLKLDKFIIPGDTKESALLDFARAICRRAERKIVGDRISHNLSNGEILKYLNRLSDLLYVMARYTNKNRKEKPPKY